MKANDLEDEKRNDGAPPRPHRSTIYSIILKVPVFGAVAQIANAYVYSGDVDYDAGLAPAWLWIKKHWGNFAIAAVLTVLSTPNVWHCDWLLLHLPVSQPTTSPGSLLISIFPNLLGFGIGVYALIFSLSSALIKGLHQRFNTPEKNGGKRIGSFLILNADMAYPLLVITLALSIGVFQQIYPSSNVMNLLSWFALWYSMIMVIEILSALFGLGENELVNKFNKGN